MKKSFMKLGLLALGLVLVLAGCGTSPSVTLIEAFKKSEKITSSAFDGSFKVKMKLPESALNDPTVAQGVALLSDMEVKFDGVSQVKPNRAEMNIEVKVGGDAAITLKTVVIVTEDKMYLKIPNTPFLPLPKEQVGKFVELDMKELREAEKEQKSSEKMTGIQKQFLLETGKILIKNLTEKNFITFLDNDDKNYPKSDDVDQVVHINLDNKNIAEGYTSLVTKSAPQILDLLSDKKYEKVIPDFSKTDLADAKKELEKYKKDEYKKDLKDLEKAADVKYFDMFFGIDNSGYMNYFSMDTDLTLTEDNEKVDLDMKLVENVKEINKKAKFQYDIPTDTLKLEDLIGAALGL